MRVGTLTGFVFRKTVCKCAVPAFESRLTRKSVVASSRYIMEQDALSRLNLESDRITEIAGGRYKPLADLGSGGVCDVILCLDRTLNRKVAIKTLHLSSSKRLANQTAIEPALLIDFQEEARATATLSHPNIVAVLDFGLADGQKPYMVLEYIQGITLEDYLAEYGPLPEEPALYVFSELCRGLAWAHKKGVMHRDIKPGNVLITVSEDDVTNVKIIDFGLARARCLVDNLENNELAIAGTPCYMAPELISEGLYDERSEVYSVGCLMYEVLSGNPPFEGESSDETLKLHCEGEVNSLTSVCPFPLSESLAQLVVHSCLSKSPDGRFQSMDTLLDALESLEFAIGSVEPEPRRQHGKWITVCLSLLIVFIAGLTFSLPKFLPGDNRYEKDKNVAVEVASSRFAHHEIKSQSNNGFDNFTGPQIIRDTAIFYSSDLKSADIENLDREKIRALKLCMCTFDQGVIDAMASMGGITSISLSGCYEFSDNDLKRLLRASGARPNLPGLRYLDLMGTGISAEGLQILKAQQHLRELWVGSPYIDDSALGVIRGLSVPNILLANGSFSMAGFLSLAQMKNLNSLTIGVSPVFTEEVLQNMRSKMPWCKIVRSDRSNSSGPKRLLGE